MKTLVQSRIENFELSLREMQVQLNALKGLVAVEAGKPHPFMSDIVRGVPDRPCGLCGRPDRDPIHLLNGEPI